MPRLATPKVVAVVGGQLTVHGYNPQQLPVGVGLQQVTGRWAAPSRSTQGAPQVIAATTAYPQNPQHCQEQPSQPSNMQGMQYHVQLAEEGANTDNGGLTVLQRPQPPRSMIPTPGEPPRTDTQDVPRRKGRPPKNQSSIPAVSAANVPAATPEKKKRGRPPKNQTPEAASSLGGQTKAKSSGTPVKHTQSALAVPAIASSTPDGQKKKRGRPPKSQASESGTPVKPIAPPVSVGGGRGSGVRAIVPPSSPAVAGGKRPRGRPPKAKDVIPPDNTQWTAAPAGASSPPHLPMLPAAGTPGKRGRGRPRKDGSNPIPGAEKKAAAAAAGLSGQPVVKKRGRPRKDGSVAVLPPPIVPMLPGGTPGQTLEKRKRGRPRKVLTPLDEVALEYRPAPHEMGRTGMMGSEQRLYDDPLAPVANQR